MIALGFAVLWGLELTSQGEPQRVLAIGSYAEDLPFQVGFMAGLQEGLGEEAALYREYLSYPAFGGEAHGANFEGYLRGKYTQALDLVLLFDVGAMEWGRTFARFQQEARRLYVVPSSQLEGRGEELDLAETVVFPEQNFSDVLELVARLESEDRISVAYDERSPMGRRVRDRLEVAADELGLADRLHFVTGDFGAVREGLQRLRRGSPVVLTPYFRGPSGEPAIPAHLLPRLIAGLDLKFYTMWDSMMKEGVLGGRMLRARSLGELAAEQSLRALRNEPLLATERYSDRLYEYVFDDALRRRYEMDASLFPEGSVFLNAEPDFFEAYFWHVLILLAAFLGLLASTLVLRAMVRRRTRELADRNQELSRALRQKSRLSELGRSMAMLAHDLRSPLCTINTCSDLLADRSKVDFDENWVARSLRDSSRKSLSMISDMLDYARTLEPRIETIPASRFVVLLEDEIDQARPDSSAVPVACRLEGDCDVNLDTKKMGRVVVNLVKNAVEALEGAEVQDPRVEVAVRADPEELFVSVSDNGPGIGEDVADQLFEPFKTKGKRSGTGLGLAIAKEFVEAHGGAICCDSSPGDTVFKIRLPNRLNRCRPEACVAGASTA